MYCDGTTREKSYEAADKTQKDGFSAVAVSDGGKQVRWVQYGLSRGYDKYAFLDGGRAGPFAKIRKQNCV